MTKEIVFLLLLLVFVFMCSGCSINVYSIRPTQNMCVNSALRDKNHCTSEDEDETMSCYRKIKESCFSKLIIR